MMAMQPAPAPAAPAANLFMPTVAAPAPAMAAVPAAAMTAAVAPAAVAAMPIQAAVAAPSAMTAAVTNQTLALPVSRASTLRQGPRPRIAGKLARPARREDDPARPARIQTIQETTLETPMLQPTGGGLATLSTTTTTPVSVPQTTTLVPNVPAQPQVPSKPQVPEQPPRTYPSPQCNESCKHKGLLHNHD